jgi:pimeloyl-ACP methyl ester carboxylesterase
VITDNDMLETEILMVNGTPITYFDSGDPRDSEDVIVLVHGTAGSTRSHFGFLFPILAAKQRVVSVDWGSPAHSEAFEVDTFVEQVKAVVEHAIPGRPAVVVGYSLGAVVAAALAAQHPQFVDRLILIAGWMQTDRQQLLRNDVWCALRELTDDSALRTFSTFCAFSGPFLATQTREQIEATMAAIRFDEFGDAQMNLNRRIDIVGLAHDITAPTMVIGCTHDQMVPLRHQKALFGAIENSRFAEVASGHAVVFERPSELTHHIQRFVDSPDEYPAGSILPAHRP